MYETIIPKPIEPYLAKFLYFIITKISKQKRGKLMHIIQAGKNYLKKCGNIYLIIPKHDSPIFKNIGYINYEIIEFPYFIDYYIITVSYK